MMESKFATLRLIILLVILMLCLPKIIVMLVESDAYWSYSIIDYFNQYIFCKKQGGAKISFKQAKTLIEKMPEKFSIDVWEMEFKEDNEHHTKRIPINFSFIDWNLLLLYQKAQKRKRTIIHRNEAKKQNTKEIINCIQNAQEELRSQIEKTEEENQKIADSVLQKSNAITDNWKW